MIALTPAQRRHLELLANLGAWSRKRTGGLGSSWKRSYPGIHEPTLDVLVLRGFVARIEEPGFAEYNITAVGLGMLAPCKACQVRAAAGMEGQCPACASERARNTRPTEEI